MGLLEPHAGHRGCGRQAGLSAEPKAVTVHSLRQAEAAAKAAAAVGRPARLLSAPGAAAVVGPAWFDALLRLASRASPGAAVEGVFDCGDLPGHALAALRHGLKAIRYDGPGYDGVADIAAQGGAAVLRKRPVSLDLAPEMDDPQALYDACVRWLGEP